MLYGSQTTVNRTASPVDKAYNYVLEAVVAGELAPGMHIASEAVAEALGISRMPVRDALRRLEGDGVVTIYANRGASVAKYSPEEIVELVDMRAVLEGLAARLALPNIGQSQIEELGFLRSRMERAAKDLSSWMARHDEFHNYLTSLAKRPLLLEKTERMRLMLRPYFRGYFSDSRELEILGLEHQRIIDAIAIGDPEKVERTVREHVAANVETVAQLSTSVNATTQG